MPTLKTKADIYENPTKIMDRVKLKLAKYDKWHFDEIDPVCLKRTASKLRDLILKKIEPDADLYGFYIFTLPVLEASLRGDVVKSLDKRTSNFVSRDYYHAKREGTLPPEYDPDFTAAVADFTVTAEGLSLEDNDEVIINGETFAWREYEEEGDYPNKVKYR